MANVNHRRTPAVYALHTGDHVYHYVGSTSVNSDNRLYQHIYRASIGHTAPVYRWMREVGIRNVRVTDLVRESDREMREGLEIAAIVQLLDEGFPLVNSTWSKGKGLPVASNAYRRIVNKSALAADPREPRVRTPKPPKTPSVNLPRVPNHGTRTEADKYKCKCDPCRLVLAQRNARRRGRPIPTEVSPARGTIPPHGTYVRYQHYDCRCAECRAANSVYRRKAA